MSSPLSISGRSCTFFCRVFANALSWTLKQVKQTHCIHTVLPERLTSLKLGCIRHAGDPGGTQENRPLCRAKETESSAKYPQVRGDPGLCLSLEWKVPCWCFICLYDDLWVVGGRGTPRPCLIRAEPFPHPCSPSIITRERSWPREAGPSSLWLGSDATGLLASSFSHHLPQGLLRDPATWSESEVTQLCPTLCNHTDCSLQGSSVHRIFQARLLEWVAISFSRGSSRPREDPAYRSAPRPLDLGWPGL